MYHRSDSDTFRIFNQGHRLIAHLERAGVKPEAYPAPAVTFAVDGRQALGLLSGRPRRPQVGVIIDDSVQIPLGEGLVGNYSGPKAMTMAPVAFLMDPLTAIRLARATKAAVAIDSLTVPVEKSDLRSFGLRYRFAACDSIPAAH